MGSYVVFDLEMCRVPKGSKRELYHFGSELIQIGAVLLDESFSERGSFVTFVCPEFGTIDPEIRSLTGITNEDVKGAPNAADALQAFTDWLPADATLVSWSQSDVHQIDREMAEKYIDIPALYPFLDNCIDCQYIFAEKMDRNKQYSLSEALMLTAIDFDENVHDALVDARNTALLFAKTQTEDALVLSPYFITQEQAAETIYNSFGRR